MAANTAPASTPSREAIQTIITTDGGQTGILSSPGLVTGPKADIGVGSTLELCSWSVAISSYFS
jgi:hypothetical protein